MRVLLTGSKGFVGNRLKPLLAKHEVTGFDFCDMDKSTPEDYEGALDAVCGDKHFDVVIHAGALVESQSVDPQIFHWNTVCSELLFCRYQQCKIIFMSSNMAVDPVNLYGWTKYLSERTLRLITPNHCILRPSAIFGEAFGRSSPLPVVDLIVTGRIEKLFADYIRDFIYVDDVAKAIADTVENNHLGTFNLGTGVAYTAEELAKAFGAVGIPVVERPATVPSRAVAETELFPFSWKTRDPVDYLIEQREMK